MKMVIVTLLCGSMAAAVIVNSQDVEETAWQPPYELPVPAGWAVERFPIPIGFAPGIPYTGVEDIRFAPGWSKSASEDYWSYAFLWYLEGEVQINPSVLERNLTLYYTGLVQANGSNIPKEKITQVVTSFSEVPKEAGDLSCYWGTISMLDYIKQVPMVLRSKVHVRTCPGENRTYIFFKLSPQPYAHGIWGSLDRLWTDFQCQRDTTVK